MSFFKRHKNKFIGLGVVSAIGAGSLYLLNKYVEHKITERRENETQQKLKQVQKQQQFDKTRNIAEKTLDSALLPALKSVLSEIFNTESILKELKSDSGNTELWHQLKLLTFGKLSSEIFCGSYLVIFTKIQLHILAGFNLQNNNPISTKTQEMFMHLSQLFVYSKVKLWASETCMPILKEFLDSYQDLTENFNMTKIQKVFDDIAIKFDNIKNDEFLLSVNDLKWNDLEQEEAKMLQALIMAAMDVFEHKDFEKILRSCLSTGFANALDQLANDQSAADLLAQKGLPLAKLIPKLDKISNGISLGPILNNSGKILSFEAIIFETFSLSS